MAKWKMKNNGSVSVPGGRSYHYMAGDEIELPETYKDKKGKDVKVEWSHYGDLIKPERKKKEKATSKAGEKAVL